MTSPHLSQTSGEFQAAVGRHVMLGWRVESMTADTAVMVTGHRCNHVLHGLLSLFTFGLWLPVWAILAFTESERRVFISTFGDDDEVYVSPPMKSS